MSLTLEKYRQLEYEAGNPIMKVKCPNCGYGGEDLKIGRSPISSKMMCAKCKMYFYPFVKESKNEGK